LASDTGVRETYCTLGDFPIGFPIGISKPPALRDVVSIVTQPPHRESLVL